MGAHSSYYLYQKYVTIGNQDPVPAYPMEFSISGDSSNPKPLVQKLEYDADCGADVRPIVEYRWIESGYTCVGYDKHILMVRQKTYNGTTWETISTSAGTLVEENSADCGYVGEFTRWVADGEICYDGDKYIKMVEQTSNDGVNWVNTGNWRRGEMTEADSPDCSYQERWVNIPITDDYICDDCPPFQGKFRAIYSGGTTYSADCDSSSGLTTATTQPSGYEYSAMTDAIIGNCVTIIGQEAFSFCRSLSSVTISNSVTEIGNFAFQLCRSLSSITIPDSVTHIWIYAFNSCTSLTSVTLSNSVSTIGYAAFTGCSGLTSVTIGWGIGYIADYAFNGCTSLTSITINATAPCLLGNNAFDYTNDCPIYVPAASVNAYKNASGWSTYASRITAIPNS